MAITKLWTEKYRPASIEEYIFENEEHKDKLSEIIASGDLPHLLLSGSQGAGKTAITEVIISALGIEDADVLRINASKDNGVDFIRDTVVAFAESFAYSSPFKIVSLQEMDYLSLNAQAVLRDVLEKNSDTCRFIGTCNYANKIMPAIKSRMRQYFFKAPDKEAILMRCVEVLLAESVEIDDEALLNLNTYIEQSHPDIRKIIDRLQENVKDGKLRAPSTTVEAADYQVKIVDLILTGNIQGLRDYVKLEVSNEQFDDVYELMYKHTHEFPQCNSIEAYDSALVAVSQAMYRHAFVAIPQLNFEEMCIHLKKALGK